MVGGLPSKPLGGSIGQVTRLSHILILFRNEQSVLLLPVKRGHYWIQTNRSWRILQRSMSYWPKTEPKPELRAGMSALKQVLRYGGP